MTQKAVGFAVGSALFALSACAHTEAGTRNDNTTPTGTVANNAPGQNGQSGSAPDPNAGQSPTGTTNPNDMTGSPNPAPDNGAMGSNSADMGAAGNSANGMTGTTNPSGQEAAEAPAGGGTADQGSMGGGAPSAPTAENTAQDKSALISTADGSQPGVVTSYANGTLTLAAQGHKHNTAKTRTLTIGQDVPIFQGSTRVSTDAIVPGADVRVYWRSPSAGERQVIAVDILNAGQGSPSTTPDRNSNQGQGTSE